MAGKLTKASVLTAQLPRLKKRPEFLQAHRRGRKLVAKGFLMQAFRREHATQTDSPSEKLFSPRFGFTASKKVGNAVARNLAKRRLRSLAHEILRPCAKQGWDYVLIARPETVTRSYSELEQDMDRILQQLRQPRAKTHRPPNSRSSNSRSSNSRQSNSGGAKRAKKPGDQQEA